MRIWYFTKTLLMLKRCENTAKWLVQTFEMDLMHDYSALNLTAFVLGN